MAMIVSVDPGEERIGFCLFRYSPEEKKADLKAMAVLGGPNELYKTLSVAEGVVNSGVKIETVVCENYRIRPPEQDRSSRGGRAPYGRSAYGSQPGISVKDFWSEVKTVRVIGACEFFAFRIGADFVLQEPKVLAMGRKWCDLPLPKSPKGHIKDDVSAYIHGAHYMMQRGMIRSVDDIRKFGQERLS